MNNGILCICNWLILSINYTVHLPQGLHCIKYRRFQEKTVQRLQIYIQQSAKGKIFINSKKVCLNVGKKYITLLTKKNPIFLF